MRPSMVLLHGLTGSGACWAPIARALEGDYRIIAPDARGHGESKKPRREYTYDHLAADVVELLRGLEPGERPVLVGHSMGGMTAAVVASRHSELLRGLVLVDPTFLSPERQREVAASDVAEQHRRMLGLERSALIAEARARHPRRSLEIIELQIDARLKTDIAAFDILTPPNPDYRELVRAMAVPTLLVIGTHTVVTPDMANELRELNPRVRIAHLEGATHGLPFDMPERLADVVRSAMAT